MCKNGIVDTTGEKLNKEMKRVEMKEIIRERRILLDLTLEDIAKAVGVSHTTVQRWETGEIEDIKGSKIKALARILQVTPGYLMGWTDNPDGKDSQSDSEVEALLERLHKDDNYRALLSSSVDLKKEDVLIVKDLIDRINGKK